VKNFLAAHGIKGRVRYYGCPAEEGGAAKGFMVRAGVFSDVDVAITWHPSAFSGVYEPVSLANTRIDFAFAGRAAHAAAAPHLGRSALDAVELMNVGVNYMREHMPSDARVHYALTHGRRSRVACATANSPPPTWQLPSGCGSVEWERWGNADTPLDGSPSKLCATRYARSARAWTDQI
jgi:metal-dependent amidase/aminoacylase/carboxypeptidase family protein